MVLLLLKTGSYVYLWDNGVERFLKSDPVCRELLNDADDWGRMTYNSDRAHYGKAFMDFIDTGLSGRYMHMTLDEFEAEYNALKKEFLNTGDGLFTEAYCKEFKKVYRIVRGMDLPDDTELGMDFMEEFSSRYLIPFLNKLSYETEIEESDLRDAAATYAFNKQGYARKLKTAADRPRKMDLLKVCSDKDILIDLKPVTRVLSLRTKLLYEALLQRGITKELLEGCQRSIYQRAGEDFCMRMHEKYLKNGDRRYEVKLCQLKVYDSVWVKDSGVLRFKIGIRD